jgi:hypothetical protein
MLMLTFQSTATISALVHLGLLKPLDAIDKTESNAHSIQIAYPWIAALHHIAGHIHALTHTQGHVPYFYFFKACSLWLHFGAQ